MVDSVAQRRIANPADGSDGLEHAAIDEVGRAYGVARPVRAKEDQEIGGLLWRGKPVYRRMLSRHLVDVALPVAARIGGELLRCLDPVGGQDEPEIDCVNADAILDELRRHGLRRHHKRRLGDVVDRLVPQRLGGTDGCVVEDDAAATGLHRRHEPAGQANRGHYMEVPVGLPLLVRRINDRLVATGAGIVDQDVGASELLGRCRHECGTATRSGDVSSDSEHPRVRGRNLGKGGLQLVRVARGDDDVRPLPSQRFGGGQADADTTSGDDGDLVA